MKKCIRFCVIAIAMMLCVLGYAQSSFAEEAVAAEPSAAVEAGWHTLDGYRFYYKATGVMTQGWKKIDKKIYYFRKAADENGPVGSMMTGICQINGTTFYFDNTGALISSGWVKVKKKVYYLTTTGKMGVRGAALVGRQKINGYTYIFNTDGTLFTGWTTYKKKTYYLSTKSKLGTRGRAATGWTTIDGKKYYFNKNGVLLTNRWISKKYYVGEDGVMLTNAITPDGYFVGSSGVKDASASGWVKLNGNYYYFSSGKMVTGWKKISGKKYYFNEEGVRQKGWLTLNGKTYYLKKGVMLTGWQTISGKKYYFKTNGRMATNTTVDGITIGPDGVAVITASSKKKVLVIAGHGQGDAGATSSWGQEQNYTRQFANLIVTYLKSASNVEVTYYKDGSLSYDCYQQNAAVFGSSGLNISSKITGKGTVKSKVQAGLASSANLPDFTQYDYVLEVHFNAKASGKDPKGDGNYTGIGFYVNAYNGTYTLEKNILQSIVNLGFKQWGSGVFTTTTLFNSRICQELGVDYGLLETAFIDDGDDMTFYTANKQQMAKAVASAIDTYFG